MKELIDRLHETGSLRKEWVSLIRDRTEKEEL